MSASRISKWVTAVFVASHVSVYPLIAATLFITEVALRIFSAPVCVIPVLPLVDIQYMFLRSLRYCF